MEDHGLRDGHSPPDTFRTEMLIREEGTKVPEALVVLGTERPEGESHHGCHRLISA